MDTRKRRAAVFLFFLLTLGTVLLLCKRVEEKTCLDVPILSEKQQAELGRYEEQDLSRELLYNGQRAAVDLDSSTVYIAQDIRKGTEPQNLLGSLRSVSPYLRLSFAPDEAFGDLAAAVENGHTFKLNVAYGSNQYMQYDLVFTTLPVLRIDEEEVVGLTEKGNNICRATMCLWTPVDPETGRYSVKNSDALWHVRGGFSATLPKTPFKLELKDRSGANKDLSMIGLGADDDWILNPMNLDDTKLKEKLFMSLWNRRAEQVDWNDKMSAGEYVEVVINQEYWGLFQLQRRIDGKFLNLGSEGILLKRGADQNASTVQSAYEIVHTTLTQEESYMLMQGFFGEKDADILNMDNFLDVNLFLQASASVDNQIKNMFFLLKADGERYQLSLLPWDTDMSWGVTWDDGFVYDFEASRQCEALREEYEWVRQCCPDLDQQMARRWFELRGKLLTVEHMVTVLEREQQILKTSGAQTRDTQQWGLVYQGEDSPENLFRIIEARLAWLDEYYSHYLQ